MDIGQPPVGKMALFNVNVALSRSWGRDTINIRLLHDFDESILFQPVDAALANEDRLLQELNKQTKTLWNRIIMRTIVNT